MRITALDEEFCLDNEKRIIDRLDNIKLCLDGWAYNYRNLIYDGNNLNVDKMNLLLDEVFMDFKGNINFDRHDAKEVIRLFIMYIEVSYPEDDYRWLSISFLLNYLFREWSHKRTVTIMLFDSLVSKYSNDPVCVPCINKYLAIKSKLLLITNEINQEFHNIITLYLRNHQRNIGWDDTLSNLTQMDLDLVYAKIKENYDKR